MGSIPAKGKKFISEGWRRFWGGSVETTLKFLERYAQCAIRCAKHYVQPST
jgi:hypothetical protein